MTLKRNLVGAPGGRACRSRCPCAGHFRDSTPCPSPPGRGGGANLGRAMDGPVQRARTGKSERGISGCPLLRADFAREARLVLILLHMIRRVCISLKRCRRLEQCHVNQLLGWHLSARNWRACAAACYGDITWGVR